MLATPHQRLPSLQQTNNFRDETEYAVAHPGIVLTATARYRNDPYRVDVRVPFIPARSPMTDFNSTPAPIHAAAADVAPRTGADPSTLFAPKPLRGSRHTLPALPHPEARKAHAQRGKQQVQQPPPTVPPHASVSNLTSLDNDVGVESAFAERKVALIKYKRTHLSASYDPTGVVGLAVGSIVIVQGDRGEHIATVVSAHLAKPKSIPTTIIRLATGDDLLQFQRVQDEEVVALEACRAHATRLGLDGLMRIEDVEFQLDFQKLTIFFQSLREGVFVDFRNLQRALYQHFRCRIWIVDC